MIETTELEKAGSIKGNKTKKITSMSRNQMLRVADKLPQAVLKVTSYASGANRVAATVKYINRNGDLSLETAEGDILTTMNEVDETLDEWSSDFSSRKNSRDTVHLVLSAPKGSDRLATHRALRSFAAETFSNNYSYVFTMHNDTDNPHGHLIVKMRGHDGIKLDPRKSDLKMWREHFAEKCHEHEIEVDCSSRLSRGIGSKGRRMNIIKMSERAGDMDVKNGFIDSVKKGLNEVQQTGLLGLKEWETQAKKTTQNFVSMFRSEAKLICAEAESAYGDGKISLRKQGEKLMLFANSIPEPKSLREQAIEEMNKRSIDKDLER